MTSSRGDNTSRAATSTLNDTRIVRAKYLLAEAVAELVSAHVSKGAAAAEWVDQTSSPLGRRRHLELVRRGVLAGRKEGRRILVRRADLDAYLAVDRPKPEADAEAPASVDEVMSRILGGTR